MTVLSPRSSRWTAVGLLAGLVFALYSLVVQPVLANYRNARRDIADLQRLVGRHEAIGREIPDLQKQLAVLRRAEASGAEYLEGKSESLAGAALQERLISLVARTGARLTSTQILASAGQANMQRITVRVQMQTDISALQRVLYALESGAPYLFVDDLEMRAVGGSRTPRLTGTEGLLDVHFSVYGYMRGGP